MGYHILFVPRHNICSNGTARQRALATYHVPKYLFSGSANLLDKGPNILLAEYQEKTAVRTSKQETSQ